MFKNDDMDERVSIKWNQILEKEDDLKEWAGEELDLSQEFENVDKEGNGSITFEQFTKELARNHALTFRAANKPSRSFTITKKAPTRPFSLLILVQ